MGCKRGLSLINYELTGDTPFCKTCFDKIVKESIARSTRSILMDKFSTIGGNSAYNSPRGGVRDSNNNSNSSSANMNNLQQQLNQQSPSNGSTNHSSTYTNKNLGNPTDRSTAMTLLDSTSPATAINWSSRFSLSRSQSEIPSSESPVPPLQISGTGQYKRMPSPTHISGSKPVPFPGTANKRRKSTGSLHFPVEELAGTTHTHTAIHSKDHLLTPPQMPLLPLNNNTNLSPRGANTTRESSGSSFSLGTHIGSTNKLLPSSTNMCVYCRKAVYKMEEIKVENYVWHTSCFVCGASAISTTNTNDNSLRSVAAPEGCKRALNLLNFEITSNTPYCKACFRRIAKENIARSTNSHVNFMSLDSSHHLRNGNNTNTTSTKNDNNPNSPLSYSPRLSHGYGNPPSYDANPLRLSRNSSGKGTGNSTIISMSNSNGINGNDNNSINNNPDKNITNETNTTINSKKNDNAEMLMGVVNLNGELFNSPDASPMKHQKSNRQVLSLVVPSEDPPETSNSPPVSINKQKLTGRKSSPMKSSELHISVPPLNLQTGKC